ncbi:hypothetical protein SAMN05428989_1819 [Pseudoxanthomonas sp. GM95]|uniref:hypothetical protein n=1 Tax=Pseudoxanthomonas sp. GM95 TaxID=1881043 RepID=UPI0008BE17C6|nr:hypothetical protein [Pseudoxanthomonas sp. GM95]SEL51395.1 hypothetical protein SAMN05428989_1819 [Pseudoxanthomonas sp. GM95]
MARRIFSVGLEIPGGEAKSIDFLSSQSLLDADIVLFSPEVPYHHEPERYQGKPCLSDDSSFRAKNAIAHWRRELDAALKAGKLVVVFLQAPEIVYAATGQVDYSGTGRNARKTRIVGELNSYEALPVTWRVRAASGAEMRLAQGANFFSGFWSQFSKDMEYQLYLDGVPADSLLMTRAGERVVGAFLRVGSGALVAIPPVSFDDEEFTRVEGEGYQQEVFWTERAVSFGRKFINALCVVDDELSSEVKLTPPPDWVQSGAYEMPAELALREEILSLNAEIEALDRRKNALEESLIQEGELKALLYEQGKKLEKAVLIALGHFGFEAENHSDGDSEFDAVFLSDEGRFLGEVEGRDNKAINIEKFSQLERNLSEDFQRDEVDEYAKGVLFGNPYRISPPLDRSAPFTAKCVSAAKRLGVALVNTPDMFESARYLSAVNDPGYALLCRKAIRDANGELVVFPVVPGAQ